MILGSTIPPIDASDPPFAVAPDIILDIPVPPSVNETRKVNWPARRIVEQWHADCDVSLMASGQYRAAKRAGLGDRFEVTIILCEKQCALDADNPIKSAIDYLRRLELIKDDDKRFMRGLHVVWGEAPKGCRIILRGAE